MSRFWKAFSLAALTVFVSLAIYLFTNRAPERIGPPQLTAQAPAYKFDQSRMEPAEIPRLNAAQLKSLPDDGGAQFNRLIFQHSPYLLTHSTNPIDWYPWGNEAFELAARENKPIFLSVGFASCHWCNVMEQESFRDSELADLFNHEFVCVKVDRQQSPEVDSAYMKACFAIHGRGGWPLNAFLTPEGKPFYVANYIPAHSSPGQEGLSDLLPRLALVWKNDQEQVQEAVNRIDRAVQGTDRPLSLKDPARYLEQGFVDEVLAKLVSEFDWEHGGFGRSQKHLNATGLLGLLQIAECLQQPELSDFAELTLDRILESEVYDSVHFGFHRYAMKPDWSQPHLEKVLSDQALMVLVYSEGYRLFGKDTYRAAAKQTIQFVNEELKSGSGLFHNAVHADSLTTGKSYYRWTTAELEAGLNRQEFDLLKSCVDLSSVGTTAFHMKPVVSAGQSSRWEGVRRKLHQLKDAERPVVDREVLCESNALLAAAFAHAGVIFENEVWLDDSQVLLAQVDQKLVVSDRLKRSYLPVDESGRLSAATDGFLGDYTALAWANLQLFHATMDLKYLKRGIEIQNWTQDRFWNSQWNSFQQTEVAQASILQPYFPMSDTLVPSGNSLASSNLMYLATFGSSELLRDQLRILNATFGGNVKQDPVQHLWLLANYIYQSKGKGWRVLYRGSNVPAEVTGLKKSRPLLGQLQCVSIEMQVEVEQTLQAVVVQKIMNKSVDSELNRLRVPALEEIEIGGGVEIGEIRW